MRTNWRQNEPAEPNTHTKIFPWAGGHNPRVWLATCKLGLDQPCPLGQSIPQTIHTLMRERDRYNILGHCPSRVALVRGIGSLSQGNFQLSLTLRRTEQNPVALYMPYILSVTKTHDHRATAQSRP